MRKIAALLVCLLVLMPAWASAMTETEWNRSCWSKTRYSLTVYQREEAQTSTTTDLGSDQEPAWKAVDALPAGSYVKRTSRNDEIGHLYISYWKNGSVTGGYVQMSPHPLENAGVYVQVVQSGFGISVCKVPEAYLEDTAALRAYIKKNYPDCRLLEEEEKDNLEWGEGDSLHLKDDASTGDKETSSSDKTSANKSAKKKAAEKLKLDIYLETDEGLSEVTVKKLGAYETVIKIGREERVVPTKELRYEAQVEADSALAVIYARNTGEITLRPQMAKSGRVTKCKAGRVALVIEKGADWSKLWYNGHVGYAPNEYLQFIPMAQEVTVGKIGSKKAPMHLSTHHTSLVVNRVKKEAEVTILWQGDTWAEVAADGFRGYIQLKYLEQ